MERVFSDTTQLGGGKRSSNKATTIDRKTFLKFNMHMLDEETFDQQYKKVKSSAGSAAAPALQIRLRKLVLRKKTDDRLRKKFQSSMQLHDKGATSAADIPVESSLTVEEVDTDDDEGNSIFLTDTEDVEEE